MRKEKRGDVAQKHSSHVNFERQKTDIRLKMNLFSIKKELLLIRFKSWQTGVLF